MCIKGVDECKVLMHVNELFGESVIRRYEDMWYLWVMLCCYEVMWDDDVEEGCKQLCK